MGDAGANLWHGKAPREARSQSPSPIIIPATTGTAHPRSKLSSQFPSKYIIGEPDADGDCGHACAVLVGSLLTGM